jgi:hypothetical protein
MPGAKVTGVVQALIASRLSALDEGGTRVDIATDLTHSGPVAH